MSQLQRKIIIDTWVKASWDEYLQVADKLQQQKVDGYGYYHNGSYRLEMTPLGFDHGCDHYIIILAVSFYAVFQKISFTGIDNCSYRKIGYREAQPDVSYYVGQNADLISPGTSIIDLDQYPSPDLVIEISKSTLADDLGNKRLLYEDLGVSEYWVVDVDKAQVIAFSVNNRGSQRIETSQIFPGLKISLLNEALERTRENNHSIVGQWLINVFQQS